jgi:hypothetical protein
MGAADMGQTYEANTGSGVIAPTDDVVEENGRASRSTIDSIKGGERLMEAIEIADVESKAIKDWHKVGEKKEKRRRYVLYVCVCVCVFSLFKHVLNFFCSFFSTHGNL